MFVDFSIFLFLTENDQFTQPNHVEIKFVSGQLLKLL